MSVRAVNGSTSYALLIVLVYYLYYLYILLVVLSNIIHKI